MNATDYLDAAGMRSFCGETKRILYNDNGNLASVRRAILGYISEDGLEGEAYRSSKLLLYDYADILACIMLLNEEEIEVLESLEARIPGRDYEAEDIFGRREEAQSGYSFYDSLANTSLTVYNSCPDMLSIAKAGLYMDYQIACSIRSIYERKIQLTYEEENEFDALNESTAHLFDRFREVRASIKNAIGQVRQSASAGTYEFNGEASWRNEINQYLSSGYSSEGSSEDDTPDTVLRLQIYCALLREFGSAMLTYEYFEGLDNDDARDEFLTRVSSIIMPIIREAKIRVNAGEYRVNLGPGLVYYAGANCTGTAGEGHITATINQATQTLSSVSVSEAGRTVSASSSDAVSVGLTEDGNTVSVSSDMSAYLKRTVQLDDSTVYCESGGFNTNERYSFYEHSILKTIEIDEVTVQITVASGLRQSTQNPEPAVEPVFAFDYECDRIREDAANENAGVGINPDWNIVTRGAEAAALGLVGEQIIEHAPEIIGGIETAVSGTFGIATDRVLPIVPLPIEQMLEYNEQARRQGTPPAVL